MSDEVMAITGMSVDNLPSGWIFAPLADLAANRSGNSKLIKGKQSDTPSKAFPYPGFSASGQDVWLSTYDHEGRAIIISAVGARCGKAFEASGKWSAIANTHIVRPNESVLDMKLFWYLINDENFWVRGGSAQPFVKVNKTFERLFPLAPLAEQKRIADKLEAVLGRVDACRARLDRVPALLKRFRQSVLAAATSGKLTEEWRMTNGVNDEWEETQIQHVANVGTGSTPLRSNSAFFAPKGTPWVTSAATSQKLVTESEEFVTDAAIKAHRLKKYPVGTLLVAMYGEGKTRGQVTELGIEATINQACAAIYVDESIITKRFVKFSLEANYLEMRELAEGGNQPNLNLSKIKEFPIGLPTLPEQQEIVRRVEDLFAFADRIEARFATAQKTVERLTPATLAKAFRGELVPQDPSDEPASALLERTRRERIFKAKPGRKVLPVGIKH